jgi:hypothetical protein
MICSFYNIGSNWVFEFWLYDDMISVYIMQFRLHHHLQLADLRSDWYSLSACASRANYVQKSGFLIATEWIVVRAHVWNREVGEGQELHNLSTDHVMIQLELKYWIDTNVVMLEWGVFGGKTGTVTREGDFVWYSQFQQFRSGSNPNPELF